MFRVGLYGAVSRPIGYRSVHTGPGVARIRIAHTIPSAPAMATKAKIRTRFGFLFDGLRIEVVHLVAHRAELLGVAGEAAIGTVSGVSMPSRSYCQVAGAEPITSSREIAVAAQAGIHRIDRFRSANPLPSAAVALRMRRFLARVVAPMAEVALEVHDLRGKRRRQWRTWKLSCAPS